ncbi:TPA: DUF551 domain-containing protein [Enterobacter hormaechei]|nr:DUF551 domain-containing protein [Enterobacter hormaechei]
MKTFTIGWLNKCRCGNKSHSVKTARGNESALWDDDAVKCNSCGRGGVIQVCEGQARVLWETDEEMAEGKPMSTITKERIANLLQFNSEGSDCQANAEQWEVHELARIALASLEAEAVGEVVLGEYDDCGCHPDAKVVCIAADGQADWENFKDGTRLYTAPPAPEFYKIGDATMRHIFTPTGITDVSDMQAVFDQIETVLAGMWQPAPVSVPDEWKQWIADAVEYLEGGLEADGELEAEGSIEAKRLLSRRAAMLQGADRPQNEPQNIPENIPATQFKPVADLYGLTSPTGGETSFTFDAVEARDFVDGGWSCQEYVELERFQEAVSGNSPVIPDGWVACVERMPSAGEQVLAYRPDAPESNDPLIKMATYVGGSAHGHGFDCYCKPTHWMPLPAAPQQEA